MVRFSLGRWWEYFRSRKSRPVRPVRGARLAIEVLEDRAVPAAGTGTVSGLLYINSPSAPVVGATISLTGTPPSIGAVVAGSTDTSTSSVHSNAGPGYTGTANDLFTFTVTNGGTVGTNDGLTVAFKDSNGTSTGTITIDHTDVGNPLVVAKGITLTFGAGTLVANDTFTLEAGQTPISLTATTDSTGAFNFAGLTPGTYNLQTGPLTGLIGTVTIAGVSSSTGVNVTGAITVTAGTGQQNLVISGGIDPNFIQIDMFLTDTTTTEFPFEGTAGAGAPNTTPVVSNAIANQSLSSSTTSQTIDLAGHFTDPAFTDSQVTFNVSGNGVSNQNINVNLTDAATPQAVANFLDYANAGVYDSNFFFRNTSPAGDGLGALQAGGAVITNGTGPSVNPTLFPTVPDEISALNLKGTLAAANTGAANSGSSQFYFNTANNPSLDHPPGSGHQGFTVFGKLADDASQTVLNTLASTPVQDLSFHNDVIAAANAATPGATESGNTVTITTTEAHGLKVGDSVTISGVANSSYDGTFTVASVPSTTSFTYTDSTNANLPDSGGGNATSGPAFAQNHPNFLLNEVPLTGGTVTDFPTNAADYLVINSVTVTKQTDFLTYSVTNSNPGLVTATLTNEQLKITKVGASTGSATITVTATDRFGATAMQTFTVNVT
jgi:peptidyl-prolyl cis-trans isomerase A (cyclophilin A)